MNELQVVVQQTPGTVTWNYEDLKKAITNALEVYKTTEYDDSNIGQAKKDRAMLNNLSKSVNARKIEIKKKCLEPYELIETQAKELMAIIQEPIAVIDQTPDIGEAADESGHSLGMIHRDRAAQIIGKGDSLGLRGRSIGSGAAALGAVR